MLKSIFCNIHRKILPATNKSWSYKAYAAYASKIGRVDFSFIKKIEKETDKLLIDVRTEKEIKETGRIPGSINIPLDKLYKKLGPSTSSTEFSAQFGRSKPTTSTQLIFTCRSGKRAQKSAEKAIELGYSNVWIYEGSWTDWKKQLKELENYDKE